MIVFLLRDFINDFNNIKCIDIESVNDEFFEYKNNEASFIYKEKSSEKLDTNYLFYNVENEENKRFLCVDLSNGKGKFYLSDDYKNMVLFDKKTDDFLSENLDTEMLDDSFLESNPINISGSYECYLCVDSSILEVNSIIGKIMIEYDEEFTDGLLLNPEEYKLLIGDNNNEALFSCMFNGERYLSFDSKSLKKVSYEKSNKYNLDEIIAINNFFIKRKEETYISVKCPFQLTSIKQEDIQNNNFYNIICSINKKKYYVVKSKDSIYIKSEKESKLSSITFYNMEKKNEKFNLEYYYSKDDALKLIDWFFHTLDFSKIEFKILFYVKDNQIEKNILDYNSLVDKVDEINEELIKEKDKVKDLDSKIYRAEEELKQLNKLKKENDKLKTTIDKLSDENKELKSINEKTEKKLNVAFKSFSNILSIDTSNFYDLINFKLNDNIYKRLIPISSNCPDWAIYNLKSSNTIYHFGDETRTGYKKDYEDINNRFVEIVKNNYTAERAVTKTLNILLCGCGDLLEVKSFIKYFSSYPGHINLLCLDLSLWPENFLDEVKGLLSDKFSLYFYKCDFYYEIMNNSFINGFDIIYFSRCLLLGEQSSGCTIDKILGLLYKMIGKKVYFSQVVNYKNFDAFDFENTLINRIRQSGFRLSIINGYKSSYSKCAKYVDALNYFLYLIN